MSDPVAADEAQGAFSTERVDAYDALTAAHLADLGERRKYRGYAVFAAGLILMVFASSAAAVAGLILWCQTLTPPAVGLAVAFVTATTVLTIAFLKATFSAQKLSSDRDELPLPPGADIAKKLVDEVVNEARPKS